MLIFITVLMLNVWAISADDVLSPNINILEELGKIKTIETIMKSLETEMERLRTENEEQAKELKTLYDTTIDTKIKMDELIKQNTALTTKLKKLEEKTDASERVKVAFSATLSALGNNHKFIGPYKEATSLVYENALTNIGNAYDTNTGIFTAPVKGVYYFNFVLFNPHAMSTGLRLLKNGNFVVGATDNPPGQDTEDTASNAVCLLLEQGDQIHLQLWENRHIYTDGNRRNTFSGHLLFTM
ncbi:cerebellin 14 isoform X1 [Ctenopharyngodon idella]|uniref:cerebellin 14 isoform X1 n=1 Tax=Ctenopharyngodon idella TaxID=7959 RepID=UPI00223158BE|nr:cerebellin 14 isoform X1 [Ctenopharyngodon idella]